MRTIFKYQLSYPTLMRAEIPEGFIIHKFALQHGNMTIWAEVNDEARIEEVAFSLFGTGWTIPPDYSGEYIDTIFDSDGFVWHIYRDEGFSNDTSH